MNILKVRRKRTSISITYENNGEQHTVTSSEAPLPAFNKAIGALKPLILKILHLPDSYGGVDNTETLKPTGLTLTDSKGNRQVVLVANKELSDASGPFNIATPPRFLELPETEGTYSPALAEADVALVNEVIEEAKEYAKGNRAQGVLLTDTAKSDEEKAAAAAVDHNQSELLGEGKAGIDQTPPAEAPKKRGRKKKDALVVPTDIPQAAP